MKEFLRKKVVSLKRNPSIIPLLMLVATMLVYMMNMTYISYTTVNVGRPNMGLCQFVTTLFSILSLLCMLNSFPRRKKPNILMLTVLFVMLGLMIFCDVTYYNKILDRLSSEADLLKYFDGNPKVEKAMNMLKVHIACVGVSGLLVALLPFYSKLIKKINTSVKLEENEGMSQIELSE